MTSALEIQDLHYAYLSDWSRKRVPTLKGISLQVAAGEFFGFLGPNGAGKTTTIKCILGLVQPTKGQIKILGQDSARPSARAPVGYLPEQPYFYDYLTVDEIMLMYATLAGVPVASRAAQIAGALEMVKLSARGNSRMRSLSKGLTQRVAMAQAIVANPKLLILDEPFSGLDPIGRKEFRELLLQLKAQGTTIFMSSHILSDVEFLCDRAAILAAGELKGVYALKDLPSVSPGSFDIALRGDDQLAARFSSKAKAERSHDLITLRFATRADAEECLKQLLESKVPIESFEYVHGKLEDLFVTLVKGGGEPRTNG